MNKIILTLVILTTQWIFAQQASLTVNVSGFHSNEGKLKVGLYNSEGNFLKEVYLSSESKINDLKASVVFKDLPVGEYAVSIYHDENNSGELEKGMFGIPKEPFACSNNAKGKMGPPKYNDAKFTLDSNKEIVIELGK